MAVAMPRQHRRQAAARPAAGPSDPQPVGQVPRGRSLRKCAACRWWGAGRTGKSGRRTHAACSPAASAPSTCRPWPSSPTCSTWAGGLPAATPAGGHERLQPRVCAAPTSLRADRGTESSGRDRRHAVDDRHCRCSVRSGGTSVRTAAASAGTTSSNSVHPLPEPRKTPRRPVRPGPGHRRRPANAWRRLAQPQCAQVVDADRAGSSLQHGLADGAHRGPIGAVGGRGGRRLAWPARSAARAFSATADGVGNTGHRVSSKIDGQDAQRHRHERCRRQAAGRSAGQTLPGRAGHTTGRPTQRMPQALLRAAAGAFCRAACRQAEAVRDELTPQERPENRRAQSPQFPKCRAGSACRGAAFTLWRARKCLSTGVHRHRVPAARSAAAGAHAA